MPPRRQQHKQQQQQQRAPKKAWGRPSAGQSNETGQSGQGAVKGKPKSAAKKQKNRDLSPLADALLGQLDPPRVREYIPRDGSCLFRCVASRVRGTALQGQQVREACVKHMAANSDDFAPFLLDDTPFDHYVYEMSRPKTWGGNLEIQAMSVVYQTNFVIFSLAEGRDGDDESATLVENVIDNGFEDTIELVLYGNHYDVIHAEGKFDLMRTIQSMVYDLVDAAVERSADAKARVLAGSKGEVEKEQEAVVFWSDDSKHSFKPISWERWLTRRQAQFDQDAAMAKETHGKAAEFERLSGYYRKHMETQRDRKSGGGGRPRKTKDVLILTGNKVGRDAADDTAAEPDFVNPDELDATDGFDFPSLPPDVGDRKLSSAITASLASDPNPAGPSGQLAGIFRTVTGSDAILEGVRITAAMSDEADDAAAGSGATGDSVAAPDEGVQKGGEAGVDSSAETEAQHDGAHQETSGNGADNSATISPSPAADPKPASAAPKASAWGQKLVIGRNLPKATPKAKAAVGPKAKAKHAPAAKRAGGPKKSAGTKAPAAKKMTSAQLKERGAPRDRGAVSTEHQPAPQQHKGALSGGHADETHAASTTSADAPTPVPARGAWAKPLLPASQPADQGSTDSEKIVSQDSPEAHNPDEGEPSESIATEPLPKSAAHGLKNDRGGIARSSAQKDAPSMASTAPEFAPQTGLPQHDNTNWTHLDQQQQFMYQQMLHMNAMAQQYQMLSQPGMVVPQPVPGPVPGSWAFNPPAMFVPPHMMAGQPNGAGQHLQHGQPQPKR